MARSPIPLAPEALCAESAALRGLARALLGDEHDAEDVSQDAWLAAIERPPSRVSSLGPWIARVAANFARRAARARARRACREHAVARPEALPSTADTVARFELQRQVVDAVRALDEPYRTTVLLRFWDGLPPRDVAARMQVPVGTVRTRLRRALELLRERLDRTCEGRERWCAPLGFWLATERQLVPAVSSELGATGAGSGSAVAAASWIGVTLMKKTWLALAALALLSLWLWQVLSPRAPGARDVTAPAVVEQPPVVARAPLAPAADTAGDRVAQTAPAALPIGRAPESWLRGTVLDAARRPIVGASVRLVERESAGFRTLDAKWSVAKDVATATTDTAGRFAFEVVRARAYEIVASAGGFVTARREDCFGGNELSIELEAGGCAIEGRVMLEPGQQPLAGASVRGFRMTGGTLFTVTTTVDGSYRASGFASGVLVLEVLHERGAAAWTQVVLAPGATVRRDVTVRGDGVVRGRVLDAKTRAPIAGAEIGEGWMFSRTVRTDREGRFEAIGWPRPGVHDVHVRATGYGSAGKILPRDRAGTVEVDFELLRAGRATGRVLGLDGKPRAGVYVAAIACRMEPAAGGLTEQNDWQATRTRADGSFELDGLRTDLQHELLLRSPGFATLAYAFPRRAAPEQTTELGDFVLLPAAIVEGTVLEVSGAKVANASVTLLGANADRKRRATPVGPGGPPPGGRVTFPLDDASGFVARRTTVTDGEGRFRFADVAAGVYELSVTTDNVRARRPELVVREGELNAGIEVRVERGLEIRGRTEDADGKPVAALVHAQAEAPERHSQSSAASASGEFTVQGLTAGTYTLRATLHSFGGPSPAQVATQRGVAAGSRNVVLRLAKSDEVAGKVVDMNGAPVAAMLVAIYEIDGAGGRRLLGWSQRTRADGGFRFEVPPAIDLELEAGPSPWPDAVKSIVHVPDSRHATKLRVRSGQTDVVLRMGGEGR